MQPEWFLEVGALKWQMALICLLTWCDCMMQIPEQVVSEFARARGGSVTAAPIVKANLAAEAADW